jgi:hypothetical protein
MLDKNGRQIALTLLISYNKRKITMKLTTKEIEEIKSLNISVKTQIKLCKVIKSTIRESRYHFCSVIGFVLAYVRDPNGCLTEEFTRRVLDILFPEHSNIRNYSTMCEDYTNVCVPVGALGFLELRHKLLNDKIAELKLQLPPRRKRCFNCDELMYETIDNHCSLCGVQLDKKKVRIH